MATVDPQATIWRDPGAVCYRREMVDIALLKKVQLFEGLNSAQLAKVAGISQARSLEVGSPIFKEGENGTEMFIIESGKVRISKQVPGVGEEALAILEPGAFFGEMAVVE